MCRLPHCKTEVLDSGKFLKPLVTTLKLNSRIRSVAAIMIYYLWFLEQSSTRFLKAFSFSAKRKPESPLLHWDVWYEAENSSLKQLIKCTFWGGGRGEYNKRKCNMFVNLIFSGTNLCNVHIKIKFKIYHVNPFVNVSLLSFISRNEKWNTGGWVNCPIIF